MNITKNLKIDDQLFKTNSHKKYVMRQVLNKGFSLEFVSSELKNDKEIVLQALKTNIKSFRAVST